jgi:hypothetical protein
VAALNPLEEAQARIGEGYDVRVLEPSPPAVVREPFTDDPLVRGAVADGRTLVAPFETGVAGDLTWDALARDRGRSDPDLAEWCAARALGAWVPPPRLPATAALVATRLSLHALAEHVLCAARHRINGKIGLRFTRGGFGTPFFGTDEQVRVEGRTLVHTASKTAREARTDLTTLGDAASAVGIAPGAPSDLFTPTTPLDVDRPFDLDTAALDVFAWWYGFSTAVFAQLRADAASNPPGAPPPSFVQIWPEHFDASCDLGDAAAAHRANFGASPGDAEHPEPYLYVGPWDTSFLAETPDPYWNEPFGSSLPYAALADATDARTAALAFLREGRDRLIG